MHKTLLALLVSVLVCAVELSPVHADDNKALAQEHYNAGLRAYNVGEFDQAINEWKAAYQYLGAPDFLFNIAQAYRQKREYAEAIFFYNSYLRGKPDAANVDEVTALRDEMVALLEDQKSNEETAPEPKEGLGLNGERAEVQPSRGGSSSTVQTGPAAGQGGSLVGGTEAGPVDLRSSSADGKGLRWAGLIAGGTGVAFVATGIAFALSASSTESDLELAAANRKVWSESFANMEESAERSATIGTALMVTGIAAIVGGGVTYYLGHQKGQESKLAAGVQVTPTLALQGDGARAGLAMGWSF